MSFYALHHAFHQWSWPWEELRHAALGDPEAREELVVETGGFWGGDVAAVDGGEDVIDIHGRGKELRGEWLSMQLERR